MCLRISSVALIAGLLAGCGTGSPAPEGDLVDCAIGAGADYSRECVFERIGPSVFIIHGPGGGFRRFEIADTSENAPDAAPFAAMDGAAAVVLISSGDAQTPMEFSVESDVYRFDPALIARSADE